MLEANDDEVFEQYVHLGTPHKDRPSEVRSSERFTCYAWPPPVELWAFGELRQHVYHCKKVQPKTRIQK